ncbi:digeranylgeranylglycerophospholipid reductase [Halomarina oriensis]|uniref:FAD-dependent oxidoreductase n=1 Tax=Halomarina oriensis TaxID=671145 RepID=A0A6B0GNW5_9EURY|nr:digeranylgeranylglycerophospholipid reductase [Halomarina oriensis]MWG35651.1 FAD-dependent oxidoreductase [Halomarina oriensis]
MTERENDHFDVVIAGAGPAGGQCARDLAARGYDVLLLETEAEAEFPRQSNKSTAGTFPSMMAGFGVPDRLVEKFTDSVVVEAPNSHYKQTQPGAVLDFVAFKRWLVEEARENGAEVRFESRVNAPIVEDGRVVGVTYAGSEEVYGDVVVDATGPSAPLAKKLDVVDLHRENQAIGIDYKLEGLDLDHEDYADLNGAMMLRLDHDIAPGGYSWIFHTGGDTAKVGVCYIQNERHDELARDGMRIDDYLEHWRETDPRFADAEPVEDAHILRGSAHIQMPGRLSTDGFMAVGDTVPTIDPLWGEGIHQCMKSGRAAAITADHCLTLETPDTSADRIGVYDELWHERVAPNMATRLFMTELLYLVPNERYDGFIRKLDELPNDVLSSANGGSWLSLARLLEPQDLRYLAKLARNRITDPHRRWNPLS